MRMLIVAAVVALALGFTIKDISSSSGSSPDQAWESRAEEVNHYVADAPVAGETREQLSRTGEWLKDWLLAHADDR